MVKLDDLPSVIKTTVKKLFQRLLPVALRFGREWPILFALAAIVSLWWLPPNVPTAGNWKAKDQGILARAGELHAAGRSDEALALIARYFAERAGSTLIGDAHLTEARIRVDILKRQTPPPVDQIRLAEQAYARARDAGVPEPQMRQERLDLARWLASRGFYGEAYDVQNELRKDLTDGILQQLQFLEGAKLAARSDRPDLGERRALFLLEQFDRVMGDSALRAWGVSARARVESILASRRLPAAVNDEEREAAVRRFESALERMSEALVEFPRGDHRAEHFLERARLYKRMAALRPSQKDFFLSQARLDLDRAIELGTGPVHEEAAYQFGDVLRMAGVPGALDALEDVIEAGGEAAPLARIAQARALLEQTGYVSFPEYLKGLGALEARGPIEAYDLDVGEVIEELSEAGRRAATPAATYDVILLLRELRRLYPENVALTAVTSELYLRAARMLGERRLEALAERDEERARSDRRAATEYYKRYADLRAQLAEQPDLGQRERERYRREAANMLYEGRLFDRAAEAYARASANPLDRLMQGLSLKHAGAVPAAFDTLSIFTGTYDDANILMPTALLLEGDALAQMGRHADALDRYKRVQQIRGPTDPDKFLGVLLKDTEGIRLDLWDDPPGEVDPTYWGESFVSIARTAYRWARQEQASGSPELRRRALMEGAGALDEYRRRYLAGYEAGTAPPPAGALSVYYLTALFTLEEGRWKDADAPLEQAVRLGRSRDYADTPSERRMWRTAHTLLGDAALSREEFGSAEARYDEAVRRFNAHPESMFARVGKLKALIAQGKLDEAKAFYQETVREYGRFRDLIPDDDPEVPTPQGMSKARWDLELERIRKDLGLT